MNENKKPFSLRVEELKQNLINAVNESKLPADVVVYALQDVFVAAQRQAEQQRENDRKQYAAALSAEKSEDE